MTSQDLHAADDGLQTDSADGWFWTDAECDAFAAGDTNHATELLDA